MSNPFVKSSGTTATPPKASASAQTTISRPDDSEKPDAKVTKKDPFARPSGGGGAAIKDDLGSLLVIRPTELLLDYKSSVGTSDVVRADWLVCDGKNAGEIREDALIFNKPLVRSLRKVVERNPGGLFVGRLVMGQKEIRGNKPFIFQDFNDEEQALAVECAESVGWL